MKTITDILIKTLVLFALSGIIFILTLINTKLLMFLNWYKIGYGLDNYFALASGIAYALGSISVIIWYNKSNLSNIFLKSSFVILDGIHVYVYQNLNISEKMIPSIAAVVFAIQTILILYFIGSVINNMILKRADNSDFENNKSKFLNFESKIVELNSDIDDTNSKIRSLKSNYENIQSYFLDIESKLKEKESIIEKMKSEIAKKDSHIKDLQIYFFKFQKSRILKIKPDNRTDEEVNILKEADTYI